MVTDVSKGLWVYVGFKRLLGLGGERVGLSPFLVVDMRGSCNGFTVAGVSAAARSGNAVDLSICAARAILTPGNLSKVEALCGVDEN